MVKMETKIYIEQKKFKDRTELKIKLEGPYPPDIKRKGVYHRYLSYWEHGLNCGGQVDYCFVVNKKQNFLNRLLRKSYQKRINDAFLKCDMLINEYKEIPEVIKIGMK